MIKNNFPYMDWECYKNGMYYDNLNNITEDEAIRLAKELLCDKDKLSLAMKEVSYKWYVSAIQHLTNKDINYQAWLGQAACMFKLNVPEKYTRIAWNKLSDNEKCRANNVADDVKDEWLKNFTKDYRLEKWLK